MKIILTTVCSLLLSHLYLCPAITPPTPIAIAKPTNTSLHDLTIQLPDIKIFNTSPSQEATLQGITISYSTKEDQTDPKTISNTGMNQSIKPKKGISLSSPKIQISTTHPASHASYLGVTAIKISGQSVTIPKNQNNATLAPNDIYITYKANKWSIDKAATKKAVTDLIHSTPTKKETPAAPKATKPKGAQKDTKLAVAAKSALTTMAQHSAPKKPTMEEKSKPAKKKSKAKKSAAKVAKNLPKPAPILKPITPPAPIKPTPPAPTK